MRGLQAARGAPLTPDDASSDRAAEAPRQPAPRRAGLLAAIALPVLALDVATKVLVVERLEGEQPISLLGGQLLLRVSRNPGAAFSFATDATAVFTVIAVVVVGAILWTARRLRSTGWAVALGLLLAGASGNLVDRIFRSPGPGRGAVVDFIDFQVWPSFNVADSAIVVGGLLAVLLSLKGVEIDGRRTPKSASSSPGPADPAAQA